MDDLTPPHWGNEPLDSDREAIARITALATKREAGVQRDRRRDIGNPWTEADLARERSCATVSGIRLDDLQALLSLLASAETPAGEVERLRPSDGKFEHHGEGQYSATNWIRFLEVNGYASDEVMAWLRAALAQPVQESKA